MTNTHPTDERIDLDALEASATRPAPEVKPVGEGPFIRPKSTIHGAFLTQETLAALVAVVRAAQRAVNEAKEGSGVDGNGYISFGTQSALAAALAPFGGGA